MPSTGMRPQKKTTVESSTMGLMPRRNIPRAVRAVLTAAIIIWARKPMALVIGLITGLGRISRNKYVNLIASTYVEIVRGVPLLVQLFYIYYALGRFVRVPDLLAAVIAMADRKLYEAKMAGRNRVLAATVL